MLEYLIVTVIGLLLFGLFLRIVFAVSKRNRQMNAALKLLSEIAKAQGVHSRTVDKILTLGDPSAFPLKLTKEEAELRDKYTKGVISHETLKAELKKLQ